MATSITIRNLDEQVKQRLRVIAAQHGKSMEAEVREILTHAAYNRPLPGTAIPTPAEALKSDLCSSVRGIWKGRFTTDEIMELTRGD
jgi:hypothetical protein